MRIRIRPYTKRIVIDPGHMPEKGGTLGIGGIREVKYNGNLAAKLYDALRVAGLYAHSDSAPKRNEVTGRPIRIRNQSATKDSYRFAQLLGNQLHAAGRAPSLHHAEPNEGENRQLLDQERGIDAERERLLCDGFRTSDIRCNRVEKHPRSAVGAPHP
jgi:N-acetylmuramoyl-L-alanine amidase